MYFVSDGEELLFANEKLSEWTGIPLEQLKGLRMIYDASPSAASKSDLESRVQGLCPPPELWKIESDELSSSDDVTNTQSFWISKQIEDNGSRWVAEYCWATGIRIDCASVTSGVLVVADPNSSLLQDDATSSRWTQRFNSDASNQLHAILASITQQVHEGFSIDSLVGQSPFADRIRRQAIVAASSEADVLIHGPLGCGKEHLARAIFATKSKDDGAELAPIHCAIADPELIQQRIADAKNSLSYSPTQQKSKTASGAPLVLLLLDVDRLSHDAQSELLGFLELPNFPLVCLATASARLVDLAAEGKFSKRLAHRLSSMTIEMVPLAERVEDIPLLAQSILEKGNPQRRVQIGRFSQAATELLMEFNWPENMNQLTRTIESAAKNCQGRVITEQDFPVEFAHALQAMRIGRPVEVSIDLDEYLASIERELIQRAIEQAKGNKTQAAKQLKISRPKLLRRLAHLGLDQYLTTTTDKGDDSDLLDSSAFEELVE